MKFTDDQMTAYVEFFRILGNIKRRTMLEELSHTKKQSLPSKTDPITSKHYDPIPTSGRQQQ
jgi:hypothetical protein